MIGAIGVNDGMRGGCGGYGCQLVSVASGTTEPIDGGACPYVSVSGAIATDGALHHHGAGHDATACRPFDGYGCADAMTTGMSGATPSACGLELVGAGHCAPMTPAVASGIGPTVGGCCPCAGIGAVGNRICRG